MKEKTQSAPQRLHRATAEHRDRMPAGTKGHVYKGVTIFPCSQSGIGKCDATGWHVLAFKAGTGLPWNEEDCTKTATLAEARKYIADTEPYPGQREFFVELAS